MTALAWTWDRSWASSHSHQWANTPLAKAAGVGGTRDARPATEATLSPFQHKMPSTIPRA